MAEIGVPYAVIDVDTGEKTCPVCGIRTAEDYDSDGECLTYNYATHYQQWHRQTVTRDGDWLHCLCGNRPDMAGFYSCQPDGSEVEPDEKWDGIHYYCALCQRIIRRDTLQVTGYRRLSADLIVTALRELPGEEYDEVREALKHWADLEYDGTCPCTNAGMPRCRFTPRTGQ